MKRLRELSRTVRGALVWTLLLPLRAYSRLISPLLPARCRYYPTCSAYAEEAVRAHGVVRGSALAAWRLVRCNPFSRGGVDEVPPPRDAKAAHSHPHGNHA